MSAAGAGWRMPADFEPHECTWVAWPNENQTGEAFDDPRLGAGS